jgi:hypothetical protein
MRGSVSIGEVCPTYIRLLWSWVRVGCVLGFESIEGLRGRFQ